MLFRSWGDIYGTQIIDDSNIDPTFSLAGYIDNYLSDQVSFKIIMELLEEVVDKDEGTMMVVDDNDDNFDESFRGSLGFSKFLGQLSVMGPMALLSTNGIFKNGDDVVEQKCMKKVFNRFKAILEMVETSYNYGDEVIVNAVDKVLEPISD